MIISLGSWCLMKHYLCINNLSDESYPFDYIRSTLYGIMYHFTNDFKNFTKYISDVKNEDNILYFNHGVSFWHHDMNDEKILASFDRKIKRILTAENPFFIRMCIDKHELYQLNLFDTILKDKYGKYKMILLFCNQEHLLFQHYNENILIIALPIIIKTFDMTKEYELFEDNIKQCEIDFQLLFESDFKCFPKFNINDIKDFYLYPYENNFIL